VVRLCDSVESLTSSYLRMSAIAQPKRRIAVVSGATGYVGSEIARALAADGMQIAALYREAADIDAFLSDLPGTGHRAYACDLRNEKETGAILAAIERELGPLYVCVHAAGEKPNRKRLIFVDADELRAQLEANVVGSFNFLAECARKMKEHGSGVIVGITSAAVVNTDAARGLGAYVPAKYALQGILAMLRDELASAGIRVYSVAPGLMSGGMNKDMPFAFMEMAKAKSSSKKLATAKDVATMVAACVAPDSPEREFIVLIAPEIESR
jgi:3-oxoacyl-[acyl-carrier protein] reductase